MAVPTQSYPDNDPALLEDKDALRKKAAQKYMSLEGIGQKNVAALESKRGEMMGAFDQAETAGGNAIRRQAALGMAAGANQSGRFGRAGYGAGLQAGADSGFAQAQQGAAMAKMRSDADVGLTKEIGSMEFGAAQAGAQGLESVAKMGTTAENQQKKQADYENQIAAIQKNNKGFFNDDEDTAYQQIMALLQFETDPAMRAYIQSRAAGIKSGSEDF